MSRSHLCQQYNKYIIEHIAMITFYTSNEAHYSLYIEGSHSILTWNIRAYIQNISAYRSIIRREANAFLYAENVLTSCLRKWPDITFKIIAVGYYMMTSSNKSIFTQQE